MPNVGIEPEPPAWQANVLSFTPLPQGQLGIDDSLSVSRNTTTCTDISDRLTIKR